MLQGSFNRQLEFANSNIIIKSKRGRKKQPLNAGNVLNVDPSYKLNSKQLQGWTFKHVMSITGKKGVDGLIITNENLFSSVGGVYAVYLEDKLLYIGVCSNTFQHRWVNKLSNKNCKRVFRHFKGVYLAEQAKTSGEHVEVYFLPLSAIREQYPDNRWVNQYGVESELIKHYDPPININLKLKKRVQ